MTLTLTLPAVDTPLTANQRLDRHDRARITKNWRLMAALQARKAAPMQHAHATFYVSHGDAHRRKRDVANWSPTAKAAIDGCTDAGVLPGDDDRYIVGPDPRLGPVTDSFVLTLVLDDHCGCRECVARFGTDGAA
ncbi:MAG TPA: hypothetical protein VF642_12395 [Propionibacteriaceae bacterium]|jgi:crossover junction endodeoxyribonuclease RusA